MKSALKILSFIFALQSFGFVDLLYIYKGEPSFCCVLADTDDEEKNEKDSSEAEDADDIDEKIVFSEEATIVTDIKNIQYFHFSITLLPSFSQGLNSPPPEVLV